MTQFLDSTIAELFGYGGTKGDYGVEVEVEGNPRWESSSNKLWSVTTDGSMKVDTSREYVLRRPLNKDSVFVAVDEL